MIAGHSTQHVIPFNEDDVVYNERRLAWIGGFPYPYLHAAATVVTKTAPLPSLAEHCEFTYDVLTSEKCTMAALLPAVIIGLMGILQSQPAKTSPLLKHINTGGLPVDSVCMDAIGRLTERISNTYASTEAGVICNLEITKKSDFIDHCAGPPVNGVELKVVDKEGQVLPRSKTGYIHNVKVCL